MQIIYKNENEEYNSRGAGTISLIIYAGKIGRCLERKYYKEFKKKTIEL